MHGSAGVKAGKANARLMSIYRRSLVFTGRATALALVLAVPAYAQPQSEGTAVTQPATDPAAALPAEEYEDDGEAIVVTGQRPRGSVIGDIPPENTLNARDVRATGATDINELLEALAPQIGSARGRGGERPILLLNGLRISSFRELRDLPTEAIQRVEILPEEVALKYGYRADQRVVNIILRRRFRTDAAAHEIRVAFRLRHHRDDSLRRRRNRRRIERSNEPDVRA